MTLHTDEKIIKVNNSTLSEPVNNRGQVTIQIQIFINSDQPVLTKSSVPVQNEVIENEVTEKEVIKNEVTEKEVTENEIVPKKIEVKKSSQVVKKRIRKRTPKKAVGKKEITIIDKIIDAVNKHKKEGISTKELMEFTGLSYSQVRNSIKSARKRGKIKSLDKGVYIPK